MRRTLSTMMLLAAGLILSAITGCASSSYDPPPAYYGVNVHYGSHWRYDDRYRHRRYYHHRPRPRPPHRPRPGRPVTRPSRR